MRRIAVVLIAVLMAVMGLLDGAEAAKPKKTKPTAPPKPIYDAPMQVVIVRNSQPECEPKCPQWIAAEGEITGATPALFRKVLKQMGKEKLPVIIRSPGGSINAALEIGKMLRQRQMTAAVGATIFRGCSPADSTCKLPKESKGVYDGMITETYAFCNSACPMLLAGATTRYASYKTSIGLHEPKTTWLRTRTNYREYYRIVNGKKKVTSRKILSKKTYVEKTTYGLDKRLRKRLGDYYKSMGVDVAILEETVKAEFKDIYILPDDKRAALKLRTTMEQAVFLGNPKLCGSGATSAVCVMNEHQAFLKKKRESAKESEVPNGHVEMNFLLVRLDSPICKTSCPAWIAADGFITSKTPAHFRLFMNSLQFKNLPVVINSSGGDGLAAITLGESIKAHGLETTIAKSNLKKGGDKQSENSNLTTALATSTANGICEDACLMAFVGGRERHLPKNINSSIRGYAAYTDSSVASASLLNSHLSKMGVKAKFIQSINALKPSDRKTLTRSDFLEYALATDTQDVTDLLSPEKCERNARATACIPVNAPNGSRPQFTPSGPREDEIEMIPKLVISDSAACKSICPVWISASGRITPATYLAFKELLRQRGYLLPPIVLDSSGGDFVMAMGIAELVRARKLIVAVGRTTTTGCASPGACDDSDQVTNLYKGHIQNLARCDEACVLLLVGGEKRVSDSATPITLRDISQFRSVAGATLHDMDVKNHFQNFGVQSAAFELMSNLLPGYQHSLVGKSQSLLGFVNSGMLPDWINRASNCDVKPLPNNCIKVP